MSADDHAGDDTGIAVIGMSGRFPGAANLAQFWKNLREGVESVRWFSDDELLAMGEAPERLRDPNYVRACPVLDDIDKFDAAFFGFSPREAAITDPQHRIFLETAWAAMESAGLVPERYKGVVGVFATCGLNAYLMHHLVTNQTLLDTVGEWLLRHMGNDMNFLATRVSYEFDLHGPSMNVQTACSSSLVAIHQATQSLLAGECDVALAGGSTISFPVLGYIHKEGEILAADGHCRPFDANSTGTLFGSGTGVVVLKRLASALEDGDSILAVIRGSAINNDGARKMGFLAPSVDGQASAVAEALAIAGISPETISYVESHGTGTLVGDPIEVSALVQAYRASTERVGYCALGSLKGNIGHLGEAAGVGGFIKTVLALQHRELPPSLHFATPNPSIDFAKTPFFVNATLQEWRSPGGPRRAGITALGAGGTNAHVIVEEAPATQPTSSSRAVQLLVLSARTKAALDRATQDLAAWFENHPQEALSDAAYTLQVGRRAFAHRRAVVCRNRTEAVSLLEGADPKRVITQEVPSGVKRELVFMFAGGGAQYAGMGRELYDTEPVYRATIDECLEAARGELSEDLRGWMFPPPGQEDAASAKLEAPSLALPALFATELATARLLLSFGLEPAAMIGHSMGEYVAACLADVISVKDGIRLVATRGRLFETLPPGGMLIVPLAPNVARAAIADFDKTLSIAAVNAPELCVVSGPSGDIERAAALLAAREVDTKRVHISVAAHSSMLDPILRPFEDLCRTIRFRAPSKPYVSNLTGTWILASEATDPRYWVQHLRHTVKFADGLAKILENPDRILVEVGPGRTLASLARQQPTQPVFALPTLTHPKEADSAAAFLLGAIGQLWALGVEPDWAKFNAQEKRRKVALPTYPFERKRHWIDRPAPGAARASTGSSTAPLRKVENIGDWFWVPTWRRSITPSPASAPRSRLVVMDNQGLGSRLLRLWTDATVVSLGQTFARTGPNAFTVNPSDRSHIDALLAELAREKRLPDQIVYLGGVSHFEQTEDAIATCFLGLFHLAQVLALEEQSVEVLVVSAGALSTSPFEQAGPSGWDPRKALVSGPVRVIQAEIPALSCRHVDLVWPAPNHAMGATVVDQLAEEADAASTADRVIAYRGDGRFTGTFERILLPEARNLPFREGGVYLITGGLGGVGFAIAEHLASRYKAKLVLVNRTGVPPREQWNLLPHSDPRRARIRSVKALEAKGAEVLVGGVDVTDAARMAELLDAARARFGAFHGVIHAAGLLEDGLIQMKTAESCLRVLAPKVQGAIVLDELMRGEAAPKDFFALFSSVSAVLGLQGQIDYAAANAFLDALASERSRREKGLTVAINWSAWRDVGMAAILAARGYPSTGAAQLRPANHTWLGGVLETSENRTVYGTEVTRGDLWVIDEHVVVGGHALLPGTGYLELAREAVAESLGEGRPIELRNAVFLAPFVVHAGERKSLRIAYDKKSGALRIGTAVEGDIKDHMTAEGRLVELNPTPRLPLAEIRARCPDLRVLEGRKLPQSFMAFGARWNNIVSMAVGTGEALLELELAAQFSSDLTEQRLHPALLDVATGGAQLLIPGFVPEQHFYVPFTYDRVLIRRGLAPQIVSHVRYQKSSSAEMPTFDVTLTDPEGDILVEIDGFVMKRVAASAALTTGEAKTTADNVSTATQLREAAFREGMLPKEGIEAFERILSARLGPQVVATSLDLTEWIAALVPQPRSHAAETTSGVAESEAIEAGRPALSTAFEAPSTETEEAVATVWRLMLGVRQLGVHDNFFELGGHSLLLTQTVTRVRKHTNVDLPLRVLLTKLTVREMADAIDAARVTKVSQAPSIRSVSRESFRVKRSSLSEPPGSGGKNS